MLEQSIAWIETMTMLSLFILAVAIVATGFSLRWLVKLQILHASKALVLVKATATIVGGLFGAIALMVVLVILFPSASDWIVNFYYAKTTIWQTEFQLWLTPKLGDSRAATAAGLFLGTTKLGQLFLGFALGAVCKWLFGLAMQKRHLEHCVHEEHVAKQLRVAKMPETKARSAGRRLERH